MPTGGISADKVASDQSFMKENKSLLIFRGNMFLSMSVIVHLNISRAWPEGSLGGVSVLTYFRGRMDMVIHPEKDFMKKKKKKFQKYFSIGSSGLNFFQSYFMSNPFCFV